MQNMLKFNKIYKSGKGEIYFSFTPTCSALLFIRSTNTVFFTCPICCKSTFNTLTNSICIAEIELPEKRKAHGYKCLATM